MICLCLGAVHAAPPPPAETSAPTTAAERVARGEYVLRAGGCVACHTDLENDGAFLAGGPAIETPLGTFYAPNITPDPEHGIGAWTVDDLEHALRDGVSPDGHHYFPVFPYTSYTRMRRDDIVALKAYLDTVEPVARPDRAHALPWYVLRPPMAGWKWLYLDRGAFEPDPAHSAGWNRGAYLVRALGHCAECHSPRNRFGAIVESRRLAGTRDGPDGEVVPNITPDRDTGIGGWARGDIVHYLQTGMDPDGDYAGGLMADVIDESLAHLPETDIQAIVTYLESLAPVRHKVRDEKSKTPEGNKDAFYY